MAPVVTPGGFPPLLAAPADWLVGVSYGGRSMSDAGAVRAVVEDDTAHALPPKV